MATDTKKTKRTMKDKVVEKIEELRLKAIKGGAAPGRVKVFEECLKEIKEL